MPIYEYECRKCDSKFELMRPFSLSSAPASCPTCKKSAHRVPSTFACFTVSDGGSATPVGGGSSCASCASGSCSTCGAG
jgi:putative FmdB family regulatory protein